MPPEIFYDNSTIPMDGQADAGQRDSNPVATPLPPLTIASFAAAEAEQMGGADEPAILFALDDDLWRATLEGQQLSQLTDEGFLAWGMDEEIH
jgi:hypothetical protein